MIAALGIDGNGDKHPLGLVEGATENAALVQALIDNLIERGLDPTVCRLFIIDCAKALSKVRYLSRECHRFIFSSGGGYCLNSRALFYFAQCHVLISV